MTLILVPKPIPPGQRVEVGDRTHYPTCDRCMRTSSDRNPVMLTERKSHWQKESARGNTRRDAICAECRELMKRGW